MKTLLKLMMDFSNVSDKESVSEPHVHSQASAEEKSDFNLILVQ